LKLDRETEALLHWVSSATVTPLWSLAPAAARDEYRRTLAKTEIVPPDIGQASDLAVPGHRLRKYVPADAGSAAEAAILFVHGGGCVLGDIETYDILCRTLCHDTRATVFSLDYRLAPEHPFPAAVEDTVAALMRLKSEQGSQQLQGEAQEIELEALAACSCRWRQSGDKLRQSDLLRFPLNEKPPSCRMSHKELDFSVEESVHADVVGGLQGMAPRVESASPQWAGLWVVEALRMRRRAQ
jgi:hypothetical protein